MASPFTPATIPGSGFAPVGAVLKCAPVNVHVVGSHPLKWTSAESDEWDGTPLAALPAGLGLTAALDGSSATITATTAGVWAFSYALDIQGTDDAYVGAFRDSLGPLNSVYLPTPDSLAPALALAAVYNLPAATELAPQVDTASTGAGTTTVAVNLAVVRLA
jgi:hypothetical protein